MKRKSNKRAKLRIETPIPRNNAMRNTKSVCFAKPLKSPFKTNRKAAKSKDLIAFIKRSKTPVIKAIVPPETPGITFAAPIAIPLKKTTINSFINWQIV